MHYREARKILGQARVCHNIAKGKKDYQRAADLLQKIRQLRRRIIYFNRTLFK